MVGEDLYVDDPEGVRIPAKMNARSGDGERRFRSKPYTHRSEATIAVVG
jgi:hypothetical protein